MTISLGVALAGASMMTATAQKPTAKPAKAIEAAAPKPVANGVIELAGWVIATDDNRGYPFAIVDKEAAEVLVFSADGKLKGRSPALIGSAVGDLSAEGIADRELKDIPDEDRTTPAGRFIAGYGPATGGQRVLWVDYETAVSIHPMTTGNRAEKREERLKSATAKDNRITHGCINVSTEFYNKVVKATFGKGGVFYVLPDELTMTEAFPGFADPNFAEALVGAYRIASFSQSTDGR
jgi:hypothetical protein